MHIGHNRFHISLNLSLGHCKQGIGTIDKRSSRPQSYQGIHIRCSVNQACKTADEKLLIDHHNNDRQQKLNQPHGHMIIFKKSRQRPAPHHMPHRKIHQYNKKSQGSKQSLFHNRRLPVDQSLRFVSYRHTLCRMFPFFRCTISCILHSINDCLRRGRPFHTHRIRQQTDRTGCNSGNLQNCLLHPAAAGRTGHSRNCILIHLTPPIS